MARRLPKTKAGQQELLSALNKIAKLVRTEDARILGGVQKCPTAREACALLVDALAESQSPRRDERLLPPPSWVHPIV